LLFDLRPKERLDELYDRREEYAELRRSLEGGAWVAVLGKRMTGKTSLVKTYAREEGGVYVNLLGTRTIRGFIERLARQGGLGVGEIRLDLKVVEVRWVRLAEDAFSRLRGKVIVLDEVQDISSPQFLKLLKSVWDTYKDIRIIFSGSYVGVMRRLINPEPSSPLYGRSPVTITLKTFTRDQALDFLRKGFEEHGVTVREREIGEAVDHLNGFVGWLTYYGHFRCVRRADHGRALRQTVEEGRKVIISELKHFLANRKRELYVKALRAAASGARWTDIKRVMGSNSKTVREVLSTLTSMMIVDHGDGTYWISDPITRDAVRSLR
jgi:AAA+ ATPase superfamily predicted ATPase